MGPCSNRYDAKHAKYLLQLHDRSAGYCHGPDVTARDDAASVEEVGRMDPLLRDHHFHSGRQPARVNPRVMEAALVGALLVIIVGALVIWSISAP